MNEPNMVTAMLCASEIKPRIRDLPTLEDKVKKAFAVAQDFWMSTDDSVRFKGACAAVYEMAGEDKEWFRDMLTTLGKFNAALNATTAGVSVDWESLAIESNKERKPLPLIRWWHDAKDAHEAERKKNVG